MRARLAVVAVCLASLLAAAPAMGFENGRATGADLAPIATGASCNQLANPAAAAYNSMSLAAGHNLPVNGCDSAYRDYAGQVRLRAYWCNLGHCENAAVPGTSRHGLGIATDQPPSGLATIAAVGQQFGWCKCWSDAPWEPWHVTYQAGHFSRPDPGINLRSPVLQRGSGGPGQAPWVRQLQHLLRRAGERQLQVDGDLGRRTCDAIKRVRAAHNFERICKVGPALWAVLRGPVVENHHHRPTSDQLRVQGPVTGIDVSNNNGDVNWDDVAKDGIEFAIVKSTEGQDYRDPYFNQARLQAIAAQGIVPGAYHFLRPRAGRTGAIEAAWFVENLQAAGYGVGDLRPTLDVEVTELAPLATCQYVKSAAERVEQLVGAKPIIYTAPYFASVNLDVCGNWIADYPLWIANYGVNLPTIPAPWSGWVLWQHSDNAQVDGVSGPVDHNFVSGGLDTLKSLTLTASGQGHGGDQGDGTRDPHSGQHRHRPACGSRAHPHRCHLRRRCDRGHERACRRLHHATHGVVPTRRPRPVE